MYGLFLYEYGDYHTEFENLICVSRSVDKLREYCVANNIIVVESAYTEEIDHFTIQPILEI